MNLIASGMQQIAVPRTCYVQRTLKVEHRFEELYHGEFAAVFRTLLLFCRDRALAEEATQEAFSRALERWSRLRDKPWVAGWVTTTALNLARRSLRRREFIERKVATDDLTDSSVDLWRAVRRLPLRQQQAIVLRYRMDLPTEEIAQVLGASPATVRSNLARARQRLKEVLGDQFYAGR